MLTWGSASDACKGFRDECVPSAAAQDRSCSAAALGKVEDCVYWLARETWGASSDRRLCLAQIPLQCGAVFEQFDCATVTSADCPASSFYEGPFPVSFVFLGLLAVLAGFVVVTAARADAERRKVIGYELKRAFSLALFASVPPSIPAGIAFGNAIGMYHEPELAAYSGPAGVIGFPARLLGGNNDGTATAAAIVYVVLSLSPLVALTCHFVLRLPPDTPARRLVNIGAPAFIIVTLLGCVVAAVLSLASDSARVEPALLPWPDAIQLVAGICLVAMIQGGLAALILVFSALFYCARPLVLYIKDGWNPERKETGVPLGIPVAEPTRPGSSNDDFGLKMTSFGPTTTDSVSAKSSFGMGSS